MYVPNLLGQGMALHVLEPGGRIGVWKILYAGVQQLWPLHFVPA